MNTLADLLWLSMDGSAGGPPGNDDAKKIAEVVGVVQLWLGQDEMRGVINRGFTAVWTSGQVQEDLIHEAGRGLDV